MLNGEGDGLGLLGYMTQSKGRAAGESMAMELPATRDQSGTSNKGVLSGSCMLPLEDFLVWESRITWEHWLRRVQHERDRVRAFLGVRLPPQNVMAERLTEEEQAWY